MYIWDPNKYSVGIDIIDEQHEYIFSLISKVYDSIINNDGDLFKKLIIELTTYGFDHFSCEIEHLIVKNVNKDEIIDHINEHSIFTKKISEVLDTVFINNDHKMIDFALFLNNWIDQHIINYDVQAFKKLNK